MLLVGPRFGPSMHFHRSWRLAWGIVACSALIILTGGVSPANAAASTLLLSPASASPGQTVTATGTGWDPRFGDVSIFADASDSLDPSAALATATPVQGTFSTILTVPNKPAASYQFFACQRCGDPDRTSFDCCTSSPFTIATPAPTPPTAAPAPPTAAPAPPTAAPAPPTAAPVPPTAAPVPPTAAPVPPTAAPVPPTAAPVPATDGTSLVVLVAIALLIAASWFLLRRRPTARRRRSAWQAQAEDAARQEPCDRGSWYCHRGSPHLDLGRRRITALPVEFLGPGTRGGRQIKVGDDVLAALNRSLDHERAGSGTAVVRQAAVPAAQGCWAAIQRELVSMSGSCDVFLAITVRGGQATCPFTLYQCRQARDSTSRWTKQAEWTGRLKDEKSYALGSIRSVSSALAVGDAVTVALIDRFVDVVQMVSMNSLLDRIRFDSEWELEVGGLGGIHL